MQALQSNMGDASLVKSACGLVRQLANSDELKEATIQAGGLELLNRAVAMHSASPATIEQVLLCSIWPDMNIGQHHGYHTAPYAAGCYG